MAQQDKILRIPGSGKTLFGTATGIALGVFLIIGVLGMKRAQADGTVYLRTVMPYEMPAQPVTEEILAPKPDTDPVEQRLLEMLYADDHQDAAYEVVENDQHWQVVRMRVTAYCPCAICCGKYSDGVTADNHRIRPGDMFVAADKMFGFGTEMIVPGYNGNQPVEVKDRGRLIKGHRLDVFFDSHSRAKKWGTRYVDVMVREK